MIPKIIPMINFFLIALTFSLIAYFYNRFFKLNNKFDDILKTLYEIIEENKKMRRETTNISVDLLKQYDSQKKLLYRLFNDYQKTLTKKAGKYYAKHKTLIIK